MLNITVIKNMCSQMREETDHFTLATTMSATCKCLVTVLVAATLLISAEANFPQDSSEPDSSHTQTEQELSSQVTQQELPPSGTSQGYQGPPSTPGTSQTDHGSLTTPVTTQTDQRLLSTPINSQTDQGPFFTPDNFQTGQGPLFTPDNSQTDQGPLSTPDNSQTDQGPLSTPDNSQTDHGPLSTPDNSQTDHGPLSTPDNSQTDQGPPPPPGKSRRPPPKGNKSNCKPQRYLQGLIELGGNIAWTQPTSDDNCVASWEWLISVPPRNSIAFRFHSIEMLKDFSMRVHETEDGQSSSRPLNPPLWSLPNDQVGQSLAPLLVAGNEVLLAVSRRRGSPTMTSQPSRFNLSYVAHPQWSMPEQVRVDPERPHGSRSMYNCSSFPENIPEPLLCDMVEQCVAGEDEAGCSYKHRGCGDWVPYEDRCLKAFFQPITEFSPGSSHVTMPIKAENWCESQFEAKLAHLPDVAGIQLVGDILRHSGYSSAAVGLRVMRPLSSKLKHLYRYVWQWGKRGSTVAYEQVVIQRSDAIVGCAVYQLVYPAYLRAMPCNTIPSKAVVPDGFVCMRPSSVKSLPTKRNWLTELHLEPALKPLTTFPTKQCRDGSLVQTFHRCEWGHSDMNPVPVAAPVFPSFQCTLGHSVHFSFVCDAVNDCADGSDEINCMAPRFEPLLATTFTCRNVQTIPNERRCNGRSDCFDGSDEEDCIVCKRNTILCASLGCIPGKYRRYFAACLFHADPVSYSKPEDFSLAAVEFDGYGMSTLRRVDGGCGEGYFQCDSGLCIPTFLLNNGERDCPSGMDENIPMENFTCPGYYRCHDYGNCVHSDYVCDGIHHCPNKDDERYCELNCPQNCTCEGYAYKCQVMLDPHQHLKTRFLDISGVVRPELNNIQIMEYLFHLNLSHCELYAVNLTSMPQLEILDLSHNFLTGLHSVLFVDLTGLKRLLLSNNPFVRRLDSAFAQFVKSSGLTNLNALTLTNTELRSIEDHALRWLPKLSVLDIRGNDIADFDKNVFSGLVSLHMLYADNYKLCCSYFHVTTIPECHTPVDELSSCSDLLSGYFYQISVWVLAVLNIPANIAVMAYRLCEAKTRRSRGYAILVANLCLSDLLMGIYLVFIGSADVHYRNAWVSKEKEWTSSDLCDAAGVLAFLSSEVSAFVICLITAERLLVMCFPLKTHLHMTTRSATIACVVAWLLGLLLAVAPMVVGWEFYGQNGFCLPLPITRNQFPGQKYAFAVFIVFNFVLFLLIGAGQVWIYRAIRKVRVVSMPRNKLQELTIARRLMLVVVTDFCCWFPIGLMGLLAALGTPIPGEVNVWTALFILPFNSALNPHLYTLNDVMGRYREQRMERRIGKTIGKLDSEIHKWPEDKVEMLLRSCVRAGVVRKETVIQCISGGSTSQ